MKGPCEVCLDNERVRPARDYREVRTELGLLAMYLCGTCSSALTVSLRRAQEGEPQHGAH